jgi:hypothetical protein
VLNKKFVYAHQEAMPKEARRLCLFLGLLLTWSRYLCDVGAGGRVDSLKSKKEQEPAMLPIDEEYGTIELRVLRLVRVRKGVV